MSTLNRMGAPDWPRLLKFVSKTQDGCWLWTGARRGNGRNEYAAFWAKGTQRAHIVAYVWTYGEPNSDLHHTCGQPLCVNPEHVTPASAQQPRHRNPIPSLCSRGHEFDGVNSRGERTCSVCLREATRRHYEANRERVLAKRRARRKRVVHDQRVCAREGCEQEFVPKRSNKRYCSEACQVLVNNARQYAKRRSR